VHRAFVGFVVATGALALLLGTGPVLTATYLVGMAYLLSLGWDRRSLRRLAIDRRAVERAFPGDTVDVELRVTNTGILPVPWVELHEELPIALTIPPAHREAISIGAGETRRIRYTLTPMRRGYHRVGPLRARTGDLLGLRTREQVVAERGRLIVYPRVVPLDDLGLRSRSPHPTRRTQVPLHPDPTLVRGVRDYEVGDPERSIHWSASAKAGRLLTKKFEHGTSRDTIVCLDLRRSSYPVGMRVTASEHAIVVAASVASHVISREAQSAGLLTEAHDPLVGDVVRFSRAVGSRRAHLAEILEILARIQLALAAPMHRLLHDASPSLPWGATLVAITGTVDIRLVDTLYRLRRSGFLPTLVSVVTDGTDDAAFDRADRLGIAAHRVPGAAQLESLGRPAVTGAGP
jgi:uncharacterized protein (DUF58 family)